MFELANDGPIEADLREATTGDLVRLDLIVLAEAQRILGRQDASAIVLHVPIHFRSLASANGRARILVALKSISPSASTTVIMVLKGLDGGTPQSRILEATTLLKGNCRAVVAQPDTLDLKVDRWRGAKLSGIAIDFSELGKNVGTVPSESLCRFAEHLQGATPALIAYSVSNSAEILAAWAAGFTHVGGDCIPLEGSASRLASYRVSPTDIYRASRSAA